MTRSSRCPRAARRRMRRTALRRNNDRKPGPQTGRHVRTSQVRRGGLRGTVQGDGALCLLAICANRAQRATARITVDERREPSSRASGRQPRARTAGARRLVALGPPTSSPRLSGVRRLRGTNDRAPLDARARLHPRLYGRSDPGPRGARADAAYRDVGSVVRALGFSDTDEIGVVLVGMIRWQGIGAYSPGVGEELGNAISGIDP